MMMAINGWPLYFLIIIIRELFKIEVPLEKIFFFRSWFNKDL